MTQLNHYNSKFKRQQFPIVLVCDQVMNAPNIGSLFRTADAFGIEKLILCGHDIQVGRKIKKTSRATEKTVAHQIENDVIQVVNQLKRDGYSIIVLEITQHSSSIREYICSEKSPIALIVGAENEGVSEPVLQAADTVLHIDMFGNNSSMNVVQAANIALYELTSQIHKNSR